MADQDRPASVSFQSEPAVVMVDSEQRRRAGLHHWVDGTMGVVRIDGRQVVIAPNGPSLSRHDLSDGGFIGGLSAANIEIGSLPGHIDHASGGPVHRDESSGMFVLVYHGESFTGGDPLDYYAFLGLAVSHDDGRSFLDLGPIITSDLPADDPHRTRPLDVGSGAFVVRDGWMYVYFQDRGITESRTMLAVARARIDDVRRDAAAGRTPRFLKYFAGRWTEPGLGGRAGDLLAGTRYFVIWFDVAYLAPTGQTLIVWSTARRGESGGVAWTHVGAVSDDGLAFSEPRELYSTGEPCECIYLTLDSAGSDQRRIEKDWFHLYRVRSGSAYRWDDAVLERVTVHWRPGDSLR